MMLNNRYIDLCISDGDLEVENGQLRIQKDAELVQEALLRRIRTPINVYTVYSVDTTNGQIIKLDDDYGNVSYELTASDSKLVLETLRDNLRSIVLRESRVILKSIDFSEDMIDGVSTVITYTIDNDLVLPQKLYL